MGFCSCKQEETADLLSKNVSKDCMPVDLREIMAKDMLLHSSLCHILERRVCSTSLLQSGNACLCDAGLLPPASSRFPASRRLWQLSDALQMSRGCIWQTDKAGSMRIRGLRALSCNAHAF